MEDVGKTYSRIEQTENEITSVVQRVDGAYTKIEQNAEGISAVANDLDGLTTQVTILSDEISASVSFGNAMFEGAVRGSLTSSGKIPASADKTRLFYDTGNDVFYYYNVIDNKWKQVSETSPVTAFQMSQDGFKLNNSVQIDGNLITNGTIRGSIFADENGTGFLELSSQTAGSISTVVMNLKDNSGNAVFSVQDAALSGVTNLFAHDFQFLNVNKNTNTVNMLGKWNFATATSINWGNHEPAARFG